MSNVTLTAGIRQNLLSLQQTSAAHHELLLLMGAFDLELFDRSGEGGLFVGGMNDAVHSSRLLLRLVMRRI
jgi:hypothetical protein